MKAVIATGIFPPDVGGPATFVPTLASDWTSRGWTVDVVTYSDTPKGEMYPYEVRRAWRFHSALLRYAIYLRHVWRASHNANVIFAQDPVAAGLPALIVTWFRRKHFVLKIVGDFAWEHARVQEGYVKSLEDFQRERTLSPRIRLMRMIERFVAHHADTVIVPSQYLAGIAKAWGIDASKVRVIYNGVEPVHVSAVGRHPHRIVTAGRLVPWKGIGTLVASLARVRERVPDATLMIIGDGPDGERLRTLVSAHKLGDAVTFTGRLSRKELAQHIAESSVFALVSSYEGFSHQLVEAFQLGAAVVASDAGGNPELVTDGQNGLLVKYGDVDATAAALLRFLEDKEFATKCGEAAKRRAGDFSVRQQMDHTTEAVHPTAHSRVVLISRDASIADPTSRAAERMKLYGTQLERLHVIALARADRRETKLSNRVTAEVVDVRNLLTILPLALAAAFNAVRRTDADIIVAQDPFEAGIIALSVAALTGRRLIVEEHGGVYLSSSWMRERLKHRLLYPIGLYVLTCADALRAVSLKITDDLRDRYPRKAIVTIPVSTEKMNCESKAPASAFGYVGRFVPQKNLFGLLDAFRRLHAIEPKATLLLGGSGTLETALHNKVDELGLKDIVTFAPFTEHVEELYARIGTLVLPSWYEGWGRVVVEAIQCGIPVVMTDVGCAGEVIRDGVEGRVVPIGDMGAFAEAMRDAMNPERNHAFVEHAKMRAASFEPTETLAKKLTSFWRNVAAGSPEASPETFELQPPPAPPSAIYLTCDPSVVDANSEARQRLEAQAESFTHLHVIVFARRNEPLQRFHGNFTVDVIDARGPFAVQRLFRHARLATKGFGATRLLKDTSCKSMAIAAVERAFLGIDTAAPRATKKHGHTGTRIVVVSRDPMAADAASYVTERLANYADQVERFHVVALAKHDALPSTKVRNYTIEVVDSRKGFSSVVSLFFRLYRAVGATKANLITVQDPFEAGIAAVLVGKLRGVKCIIEDHGAFYVSRVWPRESLLNRFRYVLGLVTLKLAAGLRVESVYQLNRYRMLGCDLPAAIAPLAMKLPDTPLPFRSGPVTFVYAGRFFYEKNVAMLVRAFERVRREVPGVKLVLAGTGPDAGMLQKEIDTRGLSKDAEIRSWVHNPDDIYRDADVAVTPTDRECWPRFPLEAMSYGLPVVMTDIGNAGAVIRDGIEGFVVDIRDEAGMTRGMLALAKDESLRRRMREAGFEALKKIPTNETLVERIVTFWHQMTGGL